MAVDAKNLQGMIHEPTGELEQDIEQLLIYCLEALLNEEEQSLNLEERLL